MIFSRCCHSFCKSSLFLLIISSEFSLNSKKSDMVSSILSLNGFMIFIEDQLHSVLFPEEQYNVKENVQSFHNH